MSRPRAPPRAYVVCACAFATHRGGRTPCASCRLLLRTLRAPTIRRDTGTRKTPATRRRRTGRAESAEEERHTVKTLANVSSDDIRQSAFPSAEYGLAV